MMAPGVVTEKKAVDTSADLDVSQAKAETPKRKKHRLLRGLLVLIVVLALLIGLLPTLLSTGPGRGLVLSIVNGQIRGTARLDDLSLGWFSRCQLGGLTVTDPQGRAVLTVARVSWDRGLGRGLSGLIGEDLGQWAVQSPHADLYFSADGTCSLADAFQPRHASQPSQSSKPSRLTVAASWTDAQVRTMRPDGRTYVVSDAAGQVALTAMNDLRANLAAVFPGGGKLTLSASGHDFYQAGQYTLANATGELNIHTDQPIDLPQVIDQLTDNVRSQGKVAVEAKANLAGGKGAGSYDIRAIGVSATSASAAPTTQVDEQLTGDVAFDSGTVQASSNLAGSLGSVKAQFRLANSDRPIPFSFEKLLAALTEGKPIDQAGLPDVSLKAQGKLDVVVASEALPGLLPPLRPGVKITAGSVELNDIEVTGGNRPTAAGAIRISLTSQRTGQSPKPLEPIALDFKLTSQADGRLQLDQTELKSGFGELDAKGAFPQVTGHVHADLGAARAQLDQVFDLDNVALSGTIDGTAQAQRDASVDGQVNITGSLDCNNLACGTVARTTAAGPPTSQPAYTARVKWTETLRRAEDQHLKLAGMVEIDKLVDSGFGDLLGPDPMQISHDLTFNFAKNKLAVDQFAVKSHLLTLDIKGGVTNFDSDCSLDLAGSYSANWPKAMELLKRIAPSFADQLAPQVAMLGDSAGSVKLVGPIRHPTPTIDLVNGGTGVGWQTGSKVFGLRLGDAKFGLTIDRGIIKLTQGKTSANGGTLALAGLVDMSGQDPMAGPGGDPVLRIDGELAVLEKVALNEEVGKFLLSRALPLIGNAAKLEGSVSLRLRDVHLPLSDRIKKVGRGSGHLDLSAVRLEPAGELGHLFKLLGQDAGLPSPVTISPFDFELRDGSLSFKDLTITLAGALDLKFRGVIRFDDSVDIVVSVPVRPSLLEGLHVAGPVAQYAKALEGVRVDIPIGGSRLSPSLDLAKVDIKPLIDQAMKKLGPDALKNFVPGKEVLPGKDVLPLPTPGLPAVPTILPKP